MIAALVDARAARAALLEGIWSLPDAQESSPFVPLVVSLDCTTKEIRAQVDNIKADFREWTRAARIRYEKRYASLEPSEYIALSADRIIEDEIDFQKQDWFTREEKKVTDLATLRVELAQRHQDQSFIRDECLAYLGEYAPKVDDYYFTIVPNAATILAPGGSGKTRLLASMVFYQYAVHRAKIVVATHSNVAVNNAKNAFLQSLDVLCETLNPRLESPIQFPVICIGTHLDQEVYYFRKVVEAKGSLKDIDLKDRTAKFQFP